MKKKQIVRLSEGQLRQIIKDSVTRLLQEDEERGRVIVDLSNVDVAQATEIFMDDAHDRMLRPSDVYSVEEVEGEDIITVTLDLDSLYARLYHVYIDFDPNTGNIVSVDGFLWTDFPNKYVDLNTISDTANIQLVNRALGNDIKRIVSDYYEED